MSNKKPPPQVQTAAHFVIAKGSRDGVAMGRVDESKTVLLLGPTDGSDPVQIGEQASAIAELQHAGNDALDFLAEFFSTRQSDVLAAAQQPTPGQLGLVRLREILAKAKLDKAVAASQPALGFVSAMLELLEITPVSATDADQVLQPIARRTISAHKSDIARMKNAEARAWILAEWATRSDLEQTKAAFARVYKLRFERRDWTGTEKDKEKAKSLQASTIIAWLKGQ